MLAERMAGRLSADKEAGLLPREFDPQLVVPVIVTYLQGLWRTLRRAPHNTIQCGGNNLLCGDVMDEQQIANLGVRASSSMSVTSSSSMPPWHSSLMKGIHYRRCGICFVTTSERLPQHGRRAESGALRELLIHQDVRIATTSASILFRRTNHHPPERIPECTL